MSVDVESDIPLSYTFSHLCTTTETCLIDLTASGQLLPTIAGQAYLLERWKSRETVRLSVVESDGYGDSAWLMFGSCP
jgi:hypothetical protein